MLTLTYQPQNLITFKLYASARFLALAMLIPVLDDTFSMDAERIACGFELCVSPQKFPAATARRYIGRYLLKPSD